MKKRILLSLPVATLLVGNAFAADVAKPAQLEEVVVSASKIDTLRPLDATHLDEASLARLRPATSDTASLLRDIPGVSLYGAGSVSSLPVIHGLADDRLRVQVDGMDLIAACPNHMNSPLSYIDPSNVASVKVFAGITPVSVGGDSIGGTILAFAGTRVCRSRAGNAAQGPGRRLLSQQRQRPGRQSFGDGRERNVEHDV